ncbi:Riboflavin synthase [bioreactor metagenome]|uniref:Riboflavin synthase n=1 Tax=bioreactor metagenome TaxID=1076179 RepID=A0A645DNF9_9ZZZZ
MFTGIIKEKGKIVKIQNSIDGKTLTISGKEVIPELEIGDSIAINGVCQTVVKIENNQFVVNTVNETISKTTFSELKIGDIINLEPALTANGKLGGHFVQGHVDTIGTIININRLQKTAEFIFSFPEKFRKYLATTGSITIDGVSLTTAQILDTSFKVALIPHTIETTIFSNYKIGSKVNLEFDIIGKYVESILLYNDKSNKTGNNNTNNISFLNQFITQPD